MKTLLGVPMLVAHRVHPATYAVARRVVSVPHISPVNVVAGRPVVPPRRWQPASARLRTVATSPDRSGTRRNQFGGTDRAISKAVCDGIFPIAPRAIHTRTGGHVELLPTWASI